MTSALDGRVALVTGGTRGIGRGIGEALLAEGGTVVMASRSADKGRQAMAEIRAAYPGAAERIDFLACDVQDRAAVDATVDRVRAEQGSLDVLVNNAGSSDGFARVHELSDRAWDAALTMNLHAAFWASRRVLPAMLDRGWGRIVNISSVEGKLGDKTAVSHYISAKHGLHGLTKAIAHEYGREGITCNAICPGAVETDTMREVGPRFAAENGQTYEEYKATYAAEAATGRLNTVEEVAAVVVLLCGPAGAGITGALWNVDGGTSPW